MQGKEYVDLEEKMQKFTNSALEFCSKGIKEISSEFLKITQSQLGDQDIISKINGSPKVELDVGGIKYSTTLTTLRKYPESVLGKMFTSEAVKSRDPKERFFIDRSGKYFEYVLDYLRTGKLYLPSGIEERSRTMDEFKYFGISLPATSGASWTLDPEAKHKGIMLQAKNLIAEKVGENENSFVYGTFGFSKGLCFDKGVWEYEVTLTKFSKSWTKGFGIGTKEGCNYSTDYTVNSLGVYREGKQWGATTGVLGELLEGETYRVTLDFPNSSVTFCGKNLLVRGTIDPRKTYYPCLYFYNKGDIITIKPIT